MVERGRLQGHSTVPAGYLRLQSPSECVVLTDFTRQQWLRERVPMLRHTYAACLVQVVSTLWIPH